MNFKRVLILGILAWLLLLGTKFVFLKALGFGSAWQVWAYYILILLIMRVLSRALGVLNFLEAQFVGLLWVVLILFLDSVFAKRFLSIEIFRGAHYWWSYFAVFAGVFFMHKKRHIHIRKEQAAHHGHH
jgi:hypothetical protein